MGLAVDLNVQSPLEESRSKRNIRWASEDLMFDEMTSSIVFARVRLQSPSMDVVRLLFELVGQSNRTLRVEINIAEEKEKTSTDDQHHSERNIDEDLLLVERFFQNASEHGNDQPNENSQQRHDQQTPMKTRHLDRPIDQANRTEEIVFFHRSVHISWTNFVESIGAASLCAKKTNGSSTFFDDRVTHDERSPVRFPSGRDSSCRAVSSLLPSMLLIFTLNLSF